MPLVRFGISLEETLLAKFDSHIRKKSYASRSEAIRDLIRDDLAAEVWKSAGEAVGTITLVYSHDKRELNDTLTELQHRYFHAITAAMHIHLDAHTCLEVIVVKGKVEDIKVIADKLRGVKGVIQGNLSMTTMGESLG